MNFFTRKKSGTTETSAKMAKAPSAQAIIKLAGGVECNSQIRPPVGMEVYWFYQPSHVVGAFRLATGSLQSVLEALQAEKVTVTWARQVYFSRAA